MGQNRVELLTPALSEQCSNRLSYWPIKKRERDRVPEGFWLKSQAIIAIGHTTIAKPYGLAWSLLRKLQYCSSL